MRRTVEQLKAGDDVMIAGYIWTVELVEPTEPGWCNVHVKECYVYGGALPRPPKHLSRVYRLEATLEVDSWRGV